MNDEAKKFLESFASGRYSNSVIRQSPDGNFLILDDSISITIRQRTILEKKLGSIIGDDILVTNYSEHNRDTLKKSITDVVQGIFHINVENAHIHFTDQKSVRVLLALEIEQSDINKSTTDAIRSIAKSLTKPMGYENLELECSGHVTSAISDTIILRLVLKHAPISVEGIVENLSTRSNEFGSIDSNEVSSALDRLRKRGLIIWQESGDYSATQSALYIFSSKHSRNSSDIQRALELGRKRW